MEKRNTTKNKLIFYIIILIPLLLTIANIFLIHNTSNLERNIKENQLEENKKKNKYDYIINETKKIEEKLKIFNNINEEINNAKNEYYQTLKTFEEKVLNKDLNYKIAYLTFDDGPYYLTHKYLEVLAKYDVRATFFTIGLDKERCYDNKSKSCQELYAKTAAYGHTMANHTYSHSIFNGLYKSTDSFINEVKKQEKLIKNKTGITTNIVRFPGGIASSGKLRNNIITKLKEIGYGWVDWTASNGDGGWVGDKKTAIQNLKSTINEDIEVILFHDYSYATLDALPDVIEYLRKENYVLLPLFYESKMINK